MLHKMCQLLIICIQCAPNTFTLIHANGRLSGTIEGSRLTGYIHCSQNCAQVQNYVNNGNLPGMSAAT